jgi:hypothetical protein
MLLSTPLRNLPISIRGLFDRPFKDRKTSHNFYIPQISNFHNVDDHLYCPADFDAHDLFGSKWLNIRELALFLGY